RPYTHSLSLHDALPILMQIVQIHIILHMGRHPAPRIKHHPEAILLYQVTRSRRIPLRKTAPHADDRTLHPIRSISVYSSSTLIRSEEHTSELQSRFDLV